MALALHANLSLAAAHLGHGGGGERPGVTHTLHTHLISLMQLTALADQQRKLRPLYSLYTVIITHNHPPKHTHAIN